MSLPQFNEINGLSNVEISDAIMDGLAPVYLVEMTTSGGWRFFGSSLVLISKNV